MSTCWDFVKGDDLQGRTSAVRHTGRLVPPSLGFLLYRPRDIVSIFIFIMGLSTPQDMSGPCLVVPHGVPQDASEPWNWLPAL